VAIQHPQSLFELPVAVAEVVVEDVHRLKHAEVDANINGMASGARFLEVALVENGVLLFRVVALRRESCSTPG